MTCSVITACSAIDATSASTTTNTEIATRTEADFQYINGALDSLDDLKAVAQQILADQSSSEADEIAASTELPDTTTASDTSTSSIGLPKLSTTQCVKSSLVNCKWIFSPITSGPCPSSTELLPASCTAITTTSTTAAQPPPTTLSGPETCMRCPNINGKTPQDAGCPPDYVDIFNTGG